jgi:DNA-binding transcriptional LysR family regulator
MRLTLRQLQIFEAVAHAGSTTAGARDAALSQSAASAALAELEHLIGARVFDRVGKRLVLNDDGRALLPMARAALDSARAIEERFAQGSAPDRFELRLAASTTVGNYVLPPLLADFRATAPHATFDVAIGNTADVVRLVASFTADLGFIEGPCREPQLRVLPWIEDELVIVAAPAHALARAAQRGKLGVRTLREAPWLAREAGSGTREAVEHTLLPHLDTMRPTFTLGSSEAIKNAVARGLGIACLSRSVVADLVAARRLVVLATTLPRLTRRYALVHHERKQLSSGLERFVAHCRTSAT